MDRLRQKFEVITPDGTGHTVDTMLSLWEVLNGSREPWHLPETAIENIEKTAVKGRLAPLVKNVHGADPKRWALRIEMRISEGDKSVTLLQKQAARSALR